MPQSSGRVRRLGGPRWRASERREWLLATAAMASHLAYEARTDFTPPVVFETLLDGIDKIDDHELEQTA